MNDSIERQDAIDVLNIGAELLRRVLDDTDVVGHERQKYEWGLGLIESYIADLKDLPSAQPMHWIPCSERLPDQYGNYLISIEGDEPDIGTINPNDPRGWSLCDANGFYWASDKCLNITAWMPLPESYGRRT